MDELDATIHMPAAGLTFCDTRHYDGNDVSALSVSKLLQVFAVVFHTKHGKLTVDDLSGFFNDYDDLRKS